MTNAPGPDPDTLARRYANLLAAARATLHAARDADPDPLWYLWTELDETGQLPDDLRPLDGWDIW